MLDVKKFIVEFNSSYLNCEYQGVTIFTSHLFGAMLTDGYA